MLDMTNLNDCYYQSFVAPGICEQLVSAGLQVDTPFFWVFKGRMAELYSYAFDKDNYYVQADANVNFISNIIKVPAYQIMDMQKLLPDFILTRADNSYKLNCSTLFEGPITTERMPDVFASMVLKAILHRKIDLYEASKILKQK